MGLGVKFNKFSVCRGRYSRSGAILRLHELGLAFDKGATIELNL